MKAPTPFATLGLAVALLAAAPNARGQEAQVAKVGCEKWTIRVDPSLGDASVELASVPPDQDVIEAIGCLLRCRGDSKPARFGGATSPTVSQILPSSTIELAALYYISYLYDKNWHHADGVALWNRKGRINPPGSIEAAYAAYETWFKKVKAMGLSAARARHLEPLAGTGLRWYGK